MLPDRLVIVDVETTGPRVTRDRVIEIGLLVVENGQLTETYQTLINPHAYVPPFIEQYTGIAQADLESAPSFNEIAQALSAYMEGAVFVAHNVRFDYAFLKNEFRRAGLNFSPKHFCTVKLSRALFPQHRRHGLDAIIERFSIPCPNRHRALDDAMVLWEFLQRSQSLVAPETFAQEIAKAMRRPSVPTHLNATDIDNLPDGPGIYLFYGEEGYPLYVGKSKNIRERVLSHFTSDHSSGKEMQLAQQVHSIETIETPGELTALLKEAQLVKQLQPLYNRQLRYARKLTLLKKTTTPGGYDTVSLHTTDAIEPEEVNEILGVFRSLKQAKEALEETAKQFSLCHKLLGLEKGSGPCFGFQLKTCSGACAAKEEPVKYNFRVLIGFLKSKLKTWPHAGPILIREHPDAEEALVVDKWCVLGSYSGASDSIPNTYTFDLDTYKILRGFLGSPKNQLLISDFTQLEKTFHPS